LVSNNKAFNIEQTGLFSREILAKVNQTLRSVGGQARQRTAKGRYGAGMMTEGSRVTGFFGLLQKGSDAYGLVQPLFEQL